MSKKNIPTHDPQTGELNPYYEELTGEPNPLMEQQKAYDTWSRVQAHFDKKKQLTQQAYEHAELILLEASAYGLRSEVEEYAKKYISEGHEYVESYHMAYNDWIK